MHCYFLSENNLKLLKIGLRWNVHRTVGDCWHMLDNTDSQWARLWIKIDPALHLMVNTCSPLVYSFTYSSSNVLLLLPMNQHTALWYTSDVHVTSILINLFNILYQNFTLIIIKEASYRKCPVGISLHVSIFFKLAVLKIHFMVYRRSHESDMIMGGEIINQIG